MNSLTYFHGAQCLVRALPPGARTLTLEPGQHCFILSGFARVVGSNQSFGFQSGPIIAGDQGKTLPLRVQDRLYYQTGYECAGLTRSFEARVRRLRSQFNGFSGQWRKVGNLPMSAPVMVVATAPGPLSRQLVQWGIPFRVMDLCHLSDQKIGSAECELRRWKETLLKLPLRFRESLLVQREDAAWLWIPRAGGRPLERALAILGMSPRIQPPPTPRVEAWLGQVVDRWRTHGYWRQFDSDLAVFAPGQVSPEFAERNGISLVAQDNPGFYGPSLQVCWSRKLLHYRFDYRSAWEVWRVPRQGAKLDLDAQELVAGCNLYRHNPPEELLRWCPG